MSAQQQPLKWAYFSSQTAVLSEGRWLIKLLGNLGGIWELEHLCLFVYMSASVCWGLFRVYSNRDRTAGVTVFVLFMNLFSGCIELHKWVCCFVFLTVIRLQTRSRIAEESHSFYHDIKQIKKSQWNYRVAAAVDSTTTLHTHLLFCIHYSANELG